MTDAPSRTSADIVELAEAGLRHAEGLSAQLARPDWKPGRAHIEQSRNSIKKLADTLRALPPPPVGEVRQASEPSREAIARLVDPDETPVAWEWRKREPTFPSEPDPWSHVDYHTGLLIKQHPEKYEVRALYTASKPDVRLATIGAKRLEQIKTLAANWKDIASDEEAAPTGSMLKVINELLRALGDKADGVGGDGCSAPVHEETLTGFLCDEQDRIGPGCDERALAQSLLRAYTISSTDREAK